MNYKHIVGLFISLVLGGAGYIGAMKQVVGQPALMSSEDIVEKLVALEKTVREKRKAKRPARGWIRPFETQSWEEELRADYKAYEEKLDLIPQHGLRYEVAGNMDYLMTLDQIKKAITGKLKRMYENGQILTEDEFKKLDRTQWYYKGGELTRIWGAEYLARKFEEHDQRSLKVPDYIIVVKRLDDIQLQLTIGDCWPIIASLKNGTIYARKIEGTGAAKSIRVGHGYTDYSADDNILKTADGDYYVVDTEYKSFYDDKPEDTLVEWTDRLCTYLRRRFHLVNSLDNWDYAGVSLDVSVIT